MSSFVLKVIFVAYVVLSVITVKGQYPPKVVLAADFAFPSGNFTNLSYIGLGTSIGIEFPVSAEFSVTATGGYINFFSRENRILKNQNLSYFPAKAGLKYYLSETLYTEGQLGATFPISSGQKTLFAWSPGLGNVFDLSGKNKLEVGVRYEGWTGKNSNPGFQNKLNTKGFIGLRFAYVFDL